MITQYDSSVDPLILTWGYFSDEFRKTGLGTQPLGFSSGQSYPKGFFLVSVNGASTLQVFSNAVEISRALRISLGLDLLPSWDLTVTHVEGSFRSDPVSISLVPA